MHSALSVNSQGVLELLILLDELAGRLSLVGFAVEVYYNHTGRNESAKVVRVAATPVAFQGFVIRPAVFEILVALDRRFFAVLGFVTRLRRHEREDGNA